ncbi:IS30 family transposase [Roseomonas sp. KE2513]|uniref:IS30 family transposase n=1 Tax=Roseomonas sp. KE2513 TaxID=2479202 RepID=UPI0018E0422F|nr:IS30 family transposase [Roseomonas sp. KE2513]MBI0539776.1 IS30 family transposase [Roseomonas sp. KE2513]
MVACYTQLSFAERRALYRLLDARCPVAEIARQLGRHRSTIHREIKRNFHRDEDPSFSGYFPVAAQEMAHDRRQRWRKIVVHPHLRRYLLQHLQLGWSPQQIAGRLAREHPDGPRLCHETIYRHIYGADGQQERFAALIPLARRRRRRQRMGRKPRSTSIPAKHWIANRPPEIAARTSFGHWECDLLIFAPQSGKANVTTLVERQSRFTMLLANDSRHSLPLMGRVRQALETWPSTARKSITFDRGTEFLRHESLGSTLAVGCFFCDPHSPWQKGSVENANGRIRRFLPSTTPIVDLSPDRLVQLVARLNATPRKCLGYRTPQ